MEWFVVNSYRLNLDIPRVNQVSFGNQSIRSFGPKIWNSLPLQIKSCENFETFKRVIKNGAIALSYPPRVRVRATVKLSAAFFHDESSITIGGILKCNSA